MRNNINSTFLNKLNSTHTFIWFYKCKALETAGRLRHHLLWSYLWNQANIYIELEYQFPNPINRMLVLLFMVVLNYYFTQQDYWINQYSSLSLLLTLTSSLQICENTCVWNALCSVVYEYIIICMCIEGTEVSTSIFHWFPLLRFSIH